MKKACKGTDAAELELQAEGFVPPPASKSAGYWVRSLEPLRAHPGIWARVTKSRLTGQSLSRLTSYINKGHVLLPPGIWRAVQRDGAVYVCFCGDEK